MRETIKNMQQAFKSAKRIFVVVKGQHDIVYMPVTKKDAIKQAYGFWEAGCYFTTCDNGDVIIDG